jgi:hypothetical protein
MKCVLCKVGGGGGENKPLRIIRGLITAGILAMLVCGCPIAPDVPTGPGNCCCNDIIFPLLFKCENSADANADGPVSSIEVVNHVFLYPGVITQFELSGGRDIDIAFPSEGQEWYEECPEGGCGDPCEEGDDRSESICFVAIENKNRTYKSTVTGYIDAYETFNDAPDHNRDDKFLSKHVYFGVRPDYPVPSGTDAVVNLSTRRDGAVYGEIIGNNYVTFEKSHPVTWWPTRYKVRYAAHPNVAADAKMAEVRNDSSFKARQRLSDDPTASLSAVLQRLEDPRDMNLNVHFEEERVPQEEIGMELPEEIDCCTEAGRLIWDNTRRHLLSKNIHVLVVEKLKGIPAGETECIELNGRADMSGRYMVLSASGTTFSRTFLHELGHNCGLDHVPDERLYNVMNVSVNNYGADRGSDIASYQVGNYQDEDKGIYFPKL